MKIEKHESTKVVQLFWDDLSASAKEELLRMLGDNGNYDVFPIAQLEFEEDEDENRNHSQN